MITQRPVGPGATDIIRKVDSADTANASQQTRRAAAPDAAMAPLDTSRAANALAEFARAERMDAAQLIGNIRNAFGSLAELSEAMRENHGALGDLLYCKDADELSSPARKAAMAEETARVRAFDDALKSAKTAKRTAFDAAGKLPKEEAAAVTKKANADYLAALKDVATAYKDQWLPAVRRNELMLALKNADFAAAAEYYQATAARWPAYANDDLGREYYVVANNKAAEKAVAALKKAVSKGQPIDAAEVKSAANLLRRSVTEGKTYVAERSGEAAARSRPHQLVITPESMETFRLASSEIVAGIGKAFYVLRDLLGVLEAAPGARSNDTDFLRDQLFIECRDLDGRLPADFDVKQAALEVSTRYYESAYNGDFAYYPAMPSIYQNFELGNRERAEAMLELAQVSAEMAGGQQSSDFWCLQSQLEIALMRRDHDTVVELMERVLPLVTEGWHIDTCANRMRTLADQRAATEGDASTNVQLLRLVASEFSTRASDLYSGTASPQAEWNASLTAKARAISGVTPASVSPEVQAGRARAAYIRDNSFSFRALTTSHSPGARLVVGGNYAYGGQIPNTEITRTTRRHGLDILAKLKIGAETTMTDAEERICAFMDLAYGYVRDGERVLEDLHGVVHHDELDPFAKHRFVITGAKERGDDATELFTDIQMGIGDCRPSNWGGGYLMTLAQGQRVASMLREAYQALPPTTGSKYCPSAQTQADVPGLLTQARRELEYDYRVVSWKVHANIAGKGPYDFERDANGRYVPTADGKLIEKEDHTGTTRLQVDADGAAASWVSKDVFYQWFYPLWNKPIALEQVDPLIHRDITRATATSTDRSGTAVAVMPMGQCMEKGPKGLARVLNSLGAFIDFGLSFAAYSGGVMRPHDPEKAASHAGVTFAGAEVAPANPGSLAFDPRTSNALGERRRQLALDIAKKGRESGA